MRLRSKESGSNGSGAGSEFHQHYLQNKNAHDQNKSMVGGAFRGVQGSAVELETKPIKGMILVLANPNANNNNKAVYHIHPDLIAKIRQKLNRTGQRKKNYDLVFVDERAKKEFQDQEQKNKQTQIELLLDENEASKTPSDTSVKLLDEINPADYESVCIPAIKSGISSNENKLNFSAQSIIQMLSEKNIIEHVNDISLLFDADLPVNNKSNNHFKADIKQKNKSQNDELLVPVEILTNKIKEELKKLGKDNVTITEYVAMAVYCEKRLAYLYCLNEKNNPNQQIKLKTQAKEIEALFEQELAFSKAK